MMLGLISRTTNVEEVIHLAAQKIPQNLKPKNLGAPVKAKAIKSCKVQQNASFGPVAK